MTLEQLLAELENPDPEARERAIRRLRIAGGPQAVSAIMGALDDPSEDVRTRAVLALGEMDASEIVPELIERLRSDPSDDARAICAFALTAFSDPRALQPFLDALHDQASGVVVMACHGLGYLQDPRAVEPLLRLLDHPIRSIRYAACSALNLLEANDDRIAATLNDLSEKPERELESRYLAIMRESLDRRREAVLDEQDASAGEEAARLLALHRAAEELRSPDPKVRKRGIDRLLSLEGPEVVEKLIAALDDPAVGVRSSAALALGTRAAPEAIPALVEHLLTDESSHVRLMCAAFMGRFRGERVTEALLQLLTEPDRKLLSSAIVALGIIGDRRAISPLLDLLSHPDRTVRFFTSTALLKLEAADARLVAALEQLAQDPEAEEHDLQADEWNCDLEKHRQLYLEEGNPEPQPQLKMRELVNEARRLLTQGEDDPIGGKANGPPTRR